MHSLPPAFLESLNKLPGYDPVAFQQVHASGQQLTSIRLNPAKCPKGLPLPAFLETDQTSLVPWCATGFYLAERPSFTFDPLFHAGTYYVQEASSMFLEQALKQTTDLSRPLRVLDLCAAPGGKSTLLQSLLSADSLLVSNEVIRTRVGILQQNMVKWGGVNTIISSNDPRDFQRLENYFDVIVVDAPCSGSGLFRREPDAIAEWSPDQVQLCRQRQERILADCWPALRQDGLLIYSTCSYSRQEDEDILDWMMENLEAASCRLQLDPSWNIVESSSDKAAYGYRFYPDKVRGEGLFIGCLRKKDGDIYASRRGKKTVSERLNKKEEEELGKWVQADYPLSFFRIQDLSYGIATHLLDDLVALQSACYLKAAGVLIGKPAAKDFIPEHDLALSTIINPRHPVLSLSREQAIQYLRKEEIHLETTERGWALAQYQGRNLGWAKILPNRINNYFPKEWRILKRDD